MNFVFDVSHYVEFELFDFLNFNFFMSNLFKNSFHLQRINIFKLRRNEHTSYPDYMQVSDFFVFLTIFEISVFKRYSKKKCLIITSEIRKNLDHPINHPSSESRSNFMSTQAAIEINCLFHPS